MKITEISPRTYFVDFETRQELLKTFIRFQEYYESPEFKGKFFTVEEYSKWYIKAYKKEEFTYYDDWSGCNVPSYIFEDFRSGKMNPLSKREKELLNKLPQDGKAFYVIGAFQGGREDVIKHEKCHALYFTNTEYKKEVNQALDKYNIENIKEYIKKLGYHESVLLDEVHAYVSASYDYLKEKKVSYPEELRKKLNELVEQYSSKNKEVA